MTVQSSIISTYAVEISYGSSFERYVADTDDVVISGDTFTSMPDLDITLPEFTGDFDEDPASISVNKTDSYIASNLSEARAQEVAEVTIYSVTGTTKTALYKGLITSTETQAGGIPSMVTFEVSGLKVLLADIGLGIVTSSYCPWTFGDVYCQYDKAGTLESRDIVSIVGNVVTVDGADPAFATFWNRGEVVKDGIRITIKTSDNVALTLNKRPPSDWEVGDTLSVYRGCDNTLSNCRGLYSNELHFGGIGAVMPDYIPSLGNVPTE